MLVTAYFACAADAGTDARFLRGSAGQELRSGRRLRQAATCPFYGLRHLLLSSKGYGTQYTDGLWSCTDCTFDGTACSVTCGMCAYPFGTTVAFDTSLDLTSCLPDVNQIYIDGETGELACESF